jgi:hypothetical protein
MGWKHIMLLKSSQYFSVSMLPSYFLLYQFSCYLQVAKPLATLFSTTNFAIWSGLLPIPYHREACLARCKQFKKKRIYACEDHAVGKEDRGWYLSLSTPPPLQKNEPDSSCTCLTRQTRSAALKIGTDSYKFKRSKEKPEKIGRRRTWCLSHHRRERVPAKEIFFNRNKWRQSEMRKKNYLCISQVAI